MVYPFSVCASDESVIDGDVTEPLGPDGSVDVVLPTEKKVITCDSGEGAKCVAGSKQNDKCCYLKGGKKTPGICKSTSYLQVVESTGKSQAGIILACLAQSSATKIEPEIAEWDDFEEDVPMKAAVKGCVTTEGDGCPSELSVNDKCCYLKGGKQNPGICSRAASIEVAQDGSRSIARIVLGCFPTAITK